MLNSIVSSSTLGIALFVATNLDDLVLLVFFFACSRHKPGHIVLGQYLGILTLCLGSLILSSAAALLLHQWVGILGIGPILIGLRSLFQAPSSDTPETQQNAQTIGSVALVTIANGSDNLASYLPVFASRSREQIAVILLTFLLMTGLWCWSAMKIANAPRLAPAIHKYGHKVFPLVLIAIGLDVLGTSELVRRLVPWLAH